MSRTTVVQKDRVFFQCRKGAERDAEMRLVFLKNRRKAQKGLFQLISSQGNQPNLDQPN